MAEIELSILSRQCTNRRIPDKPTLAKEVAAWERDRNNLKVQIIGNSNLIMLALNSSGFILSQL
jgi:hypothetical protein